MPPSITSTLQSNFSPSTVHTNSTLFVLLGGANNLQHKKVLRKQGCVYTSRSGLDLQIIYFERDSDVGRIAVQNWIGSAIFRLNAKCIRAKSRSNPVYIRSILTRVNVALDAICLTSV